MKFVSYLHAGADGVGVLENDSIEVLSVGSLQALLVERPRDTGLVAFADSLRSGRHLPLEDVRLTAPSGSGRNVFAVGWNYTDHFAEGASARNGEVELPSHPTFFTKTPQTLVGAEDPIVVDTDISERWDYEAEIAIILTGGGRDIAVEDAEACIAGFLLSNDVTARDVQRRHGGQWFKGKTLDSTCPLGPYLVTPDELSGGRPSTIELAVNGTLLQSAKASDMYFDFASIISELSQGLALLPGDIILTGTPSGVGYVRQPSAWLIAGDEVVVSSPELGELRNLVVDRATVGS